jgi:chromosome segregation ATPase
VEDRITRLEGKIDKLTEVVVALATVEEKIRSINHRLGNYENQMQGLYEQNKEITKSLAELTLKTLPQTELNSKFIWSGISVVTACVTAVLVKFFS